MVVGGYEYVRRVVQLRQEMAFVRIRAIVRVKVQYFQGFRDVK